MTERKTSYSVYVHTYPGVNIYAVDLQEDKAVVHVDEAAIIIRDVETANALVNAALEARAILRNLEAH